MINSSRQFAAARAIFISCSVAQGAALAQPGGSLTLDNRELERKVLAISVSRPRVEVDLHVAKPFLAHHVSHDLLQATHRLAFKGPPQPQVSAVCPEAFAEFVPSGSRQVELFRSNDLNACNDVMSLDGYTMDAT